MYQIINHEKKSQFLELKISITGKTWTDEVAKQTKNAAKNISIQGFRKGKAPANKVAELINPIDVYEKAANHVLGPVLQELVKDKIVEEDDEVINEAPKVEIVDINEKTLVVLVKFELLPKLELADYKQIPAIDKPDVVKDTQVEEQIKQLLKSKAEVSTKTAGTIVEGDITIIDFKGTVDGKVLDSATAENYELEIGSNSFIPGFEAGLIGLKKDETKVLELKFPKDYHQADLADKAVSFEVKIKEIKEVKYPLLDDALVQEIAKEELNLKDQTTIKTVADFKAFIRKHLQNNLDNVAKKNNINKIRLYLVEHTKYSHIPKIMITEQKKRLQYEINHQMAQYQIKLEEFLKIQGIEKAKFEENLNKEAIQNIKYILAIEEISKQEKIEVSEAEIQAQINKYLEEFANDKNVKDNPEDIKQRLLSQADLIETLILNDKVVDFLIIKNQK